MKAKRLSDGKIVEVQHHGCRNGEIVSYHSSFTDFYKPEQLDFNVVETKDVGTTEKPFDWQSFRAEAAKDILSNSLIPFALREFDEETINVDYWAEQAVLWADNLITKLKANGND